MIKKLKKLIRRIFIINLLITIFYNRKKRSITGSLTELFLYKKYFIKNNNKKIFSLRNFGGSTATRGRSFYKKEPDTVNWINNFEINSNFLDVGANIGIFSLYAGKKGHTVISLEPDSLNFALLNLNIFDNNLVNNITAYPLSIHSINKLSKLTIPTMYWGKSGSVFDKKLLIDKKKYTKYFVQGSYGITIDKLTQEIPFNPKYIKIDVDGNELETIKGMKILLANKTVKSILIEIDDSIKSSIDLKSILNEASYKVVSKFRIDKKSEIYNYIFTIDE